MDHESQSAETQNAILEAAIGLFIERGFETTSMDAIAEAAGVAKGTLYYHFSSKEGIVDAIVARYAAEVEARLAAIVVKDAGFVDKMSAVGAVLDELNSKHFSRLHRMKYIDIHLKTNSAMVTRFAPVIARIVEQGIQQGACSTAFPLELMEILLAAASVLLDPELGVESGSRRRSALFRLMAGALGISEEIVQRMSGLGVAQ